MFRGVNTINLDAKGRMAMPARYRDRLVDEFGGKLVVTIDPMAKCLLVYPVDIWEEIQKKVEMMSTTNPVTRRFQRLLIGYAADVELDSSGRMLLPQKLRDYAALDKQIELAGQGKKFELWSGENWNAENEAWQSDLSSGKELPEELLDLSL